MTSDDGADSSSARANFRTVDQTPRARGHILQPTWTNEGAFNARLEQLAPYVVDKTVLDVGCTSALGREDWIHAGLASRARHVTGVDIDVDAVAAANALGFDVRVGDAETLDLAERYEVVHAGELIEHLDNPHAFLQAARDRIEPGGVLLLTTPNVFAVSNFVYRVGGTPKVNADHTCWYCEDTLGQLLERNGYRVREVRYLRHATPGRARAIVANGLRNLLPERLAWNTLFMVAEPVALHRS